MARGQAWVRGNSPQVEINEANSATLGFMIFTGSEASPAQTYSRPSANSSSNIQIPAWRFAQQIPHVGENNVRGGGGRKPLPATALVPGIMSC